MIDQVRKFIQQHHLLTTDKPVLVGLSGGADSVALLAVLHRLGYACVALHCNFHLRGAESMRDEQFARQLATDHFQIPFYKQDFQTEDYAQAHHVSIEMAARELRYAWFDQMRDKWQAQAIAVAHHRDDQVETVLLNLLRGSGIRGLSGMSPKQGFVVRPFLAVSREAILQWLNQENLTYVTDSSNLSDAYQRNFIRLRIMPLLEQMNPSAKQSIARTAVHLADAEQLYQVALQQAKASICLSDNRFSIPHLIHQPARATVLHELLHPYGFSRTTCQSIDMALEGLSGKEFYSTTHRLVKDRESLWVVPISSQETDASFWIQEGQSVWEGPISLTLQMLEYTSEIQIPISKEEICVDYDKLQFPLCLRHWKKGDWFIPFGMKGRKKLSDYFSDHKYCRIEKEQTWLLCSGDDVVWMVGERLDNRYRIGERTKKVLHVKISH